MREHLHLSNNAATLRSAAVKQPLGEPPKEISLLLEKLGEREREETGSSSPAPASPGAAG